MNARVPGKPPTEALPEVVMPRCEPERILAGQKALVTGANSGIGRGIALALGRSGAQVMVNYLRDEGSAQAVVDEITAAGGAAAAHQTDVTQEDQVRGMFERTVREFGTVDILVNNAGIQLDAPFIDMTLEQWNRVIDVNLTGQFLCAREAIREFLRRGVVPEISCSAGKIICISSVHEVIPWAGRVNYAASKGGVMLMMQSIAQEYAPHRIRANNIAPGATRTDINRPAWETPEAMADLMRLIPYRRIGEPEDIGHAAVWLVSDYADYINGTTLYVDGGMTLYPGFASGG
jgi:glucose 1-dehydrogenase